MYYPDEVIQEVRERNDIVSVISGYVSLTRRGSNYWGCCPFHNEKTASFSVKQGEQFYYCFGCHAGGNVFTFLQKVENMTFTEALQELADRAGITLPEAEITPQEKARMERKARMYEMNREAARFFYYQLTRTDIGSKARDYLAGRAVNEEYIRRFGLGYSPIGVSSLHGYLRSKGYSTEEMEAARLISVKNGRIYDYFFNRLMFPIFNANGKTIAFGGRVMGEGEPKYLNSPDTEVFNKRKNLYGMQIARKSRRPQAIMVEGYMDVLSLHQAGFDNAVASLGTALTQDQARLMKRFFNEVTLIYDSDGAGTNAALRGFPILEEAGLKVKILRVPGAKDPDEFLKSESPEAFEKLLEEKTMNPVQFRALVEGQKPGSETAEGRIAQIRNVASTIASYESDMEREIYIQQMSKELRIDERSLRKEVDSARRNDGILEYTPTAGNVRRNLETRKAPDEQMQILSIMINYPELRSYISELVSVEDFPSEEESPNIYKVVAAQLLDPAGRQIQAPDLISISPEERDQEKITALLTYKVPEDKAEQEKLLTDVIRRLKAGALERKGRMIPDEDLKGLQQLINEKKEWQHFVAHLP